MAQPHSKKLAFGLVEVLLSGAVIIIILGALVMIARAAFNNDLYLQKRAQAIYLAQGGLEIVRQIRDSNWIDGYNDSQWDNLTVSPNYKFTGVGTALCFKVGVIGTFHATNRYALITPTTVNYADCKALVTGTRTSAEEIEVYPIITDFGISESVPAYDQVDTFAAQDNFYRTVFVEPNGSLIPAVSGPALTPAENALKVTVFVGYDFNGQQKVTEMSEMLTNWRPDY